MVPTVGSSFGSRIWFESGSYFISSLGVRLVRSSSSGSYFVPSLDVRLVHSSSSGSYFVSSLDVSLVRTEIKMVTVPTSLADSDPSRGEPCYRQ